MNLKFIISLINFLFVAFCLSGLMGFVASFFVYHDFYILLGTAVSALVFIMAFYIKAVIIKVYYAKCRFPFEFLSVLNQLHLLDRVRLNSYNAQLLLETLTPFEDTPIFLNANKLDAFIEPLRSFSDSYNLEFKERHFFVNGLKLDWACIYSWEVKNVSEYSRGEVILNMFQDEIMEKYKIDLNKFEIFWIDFLILMAHFKGKSMMKSEVSMQG
jgi:hypothetical protein